MSRPPIKPEVTAMIETLHEGDLIELTARPMSGRGRNVRAVAVFLDRKTTEYTKSIFVSFRPKAGTTEYELDQLLEVKRLKSYMSRLGRRDEPEVKLPYRVKE